MVKRVVSLRQKGSSLVGMQAPRIVIIWVGLMRGIVADSS